MPTFRPSRINLINGGNYRLKYFLKVLADILQTVRQDNIFDTNVFVYKIVDKLCVNCVDANDGNGKPSQKCLWPYIFIGGKIKILRILKYTSGLNFASAAILNQNLLFEMTWRAGYYKFTTSGDVWDFSGSRCCFIGVVRCHLGAGCF
jgi:hypothetical protein